MDTAPAEPPSSESLPATVQPSAPLPSAVDGRILSTILEPAELEQLPLAVVQKIETNFDGRFSEFLTAKALHDNAQRKVGECE